ncbi:MAG TPA: hypothetical protein VK171_04300 [Fimbriimonas sp.]|nr:hypothetical protein [Fimbriimonas sp.]
MDRIVEQSAAKHIDASEIGAVSNSGTWSAYIPPSITPRIAAQKSVFTIEPDPEDVQESLFGDDNETFKFIIPHQHKQSLAESLVCFGIDAGTLRPDLEGLCAHVASQQF